MVATLSFGTSAWFVKQQTPVPNTLEVATIECGPMVYCIKGGDLTENEFEHGNICFQRYGGSFTSLPVAEWRYALGLAILSLVLMWCYAIVSMCTLCCCRPCIRTIRAVQPVAAGLFIAALIFTFLGLKDLSQETNLTSPSLCTMCAGAEMFDVGDCVLGWSAVAAITAAVGALVVSALGYFVPHKYNRIQPEIVQVLKTDDFNLHYNGVSHSPARNQLGKSTTTVPLFQTR